MRGAAPSSDSAQPAGRFTLGPSNFRLFCWLAVSVVGLLEALSHRFQMGDDGVNYLEVAQNYLRGDWHNAVNAYWSPLYSWLLAIPLSFLHSSLYWESTLVHLVGFVIFLSSYAAFEFLLSELLRSPLAGRSGHDPVAGLSESAWRILGLALFLYSALFLAEYNGTTPDLCVTVAVFAATGLLLRIQSGRAGWGTYAWFGAAVGLGYLAKAAMFPLSFIFFGVAFFAAPASEKHRSRILAAVFTFALIAGPWVAVLSHSKGRLTFGDGGKFAYLAAMNTGWKSGFKGLSLSDDSHYVHTFAKLADHPEALGFASPISGSFPPSYDGTYWLEGAKAQFRWSAQLTILHGSYDYYFDMLLGEKGLLAGLLILVLVQGKFRLYIATLARSWPIWLPAAAALGMYALVLVQTRYVAPFAALIWISLFASLRFPDSGETKRWLLAVPIAILLVIALPIGRSLVSDAYRTFRPEPFEDWAIAGALHRSGVPSNHSIAIIGLPAGTLYWARLAGVRIVAAVPPGAVGDYWSAPPDVQAHLNSLFAQTGAIAVVSCAPPPYRNLPGWTQLASSSCYLTLLPSAPQSESSHPNE
jgi:hypothetical protein